MSEKVDATDGAGTSEPGIAVVRGFNEALTRGDVPGMLDFLDPEVEWRAPESVPWGGLPRPRGVSRIPRKTL
jgi:ketosteroid isomerase-like protein